MPGCKYIILWLMIFSKQEIICINMLIKCLPKQNSTTDNIQMITNTTSKLMKFLFKKLFIIDLFYNHFNNLCKR